jgi:hypothetical protein
VRRSCFFDGHGWGPCCHRADGRPDRAHLIPQARIKEVFARRHEPVPDLTDERLIVAACRRHHGIFDRKLRKLRLKDFPPTLLAWAQQYGFYFDPESAEWRGELRTPVPDEDDAS